MAKSPDAFRTISEVSTWLDTPAHVLRFWESKFPQIKPIKRAGGRRYYRPDDMALLSGIKILLHEQGMTIKGAQKLLREKGVRHVTEMGSGLSMDTDDVIEATVSQPKPTPTQIQLPGLVPASSSDPASWDPEDPWPADPIPTEEAATAEPAATGSAPPATTPPRAEPPPARHEVSLPFVRARVEASEPPQPSPDAEIFEFAKPAPRVPPAMPDEDAIVGQSGAITLVLTADRRRLRSKAAHMAPLVARLEAVAQRLSQTNG